VWGPRDAGFSSGRTTVPAELGGRARRVGIRKCCDPPHKRPQESRALAPRMVLTVCRLQPGCPVAGHRHGPSKHRCCRYVSNGVGWQHGSGVGSFFRTQDHRSVTRSRRRDQTNRAEPGRRLARNPERNPNRTCGASVATLARASANPSLQPADQESIKIRMGDLRQNPTSARHV
jgi:hypothetical protein